MKIRDIMRPGPITIAANDSLAAAQRAMARAHIRHLPVVQGDRLVGVLSERDVLAARANAAGDAWRTKPVADVMSAPPHTASPDDPLTEVAGRMALEEIGAMPIVELGKLLGIATVSDVLDAEVREAMEPSPIRVATAADAMTPWPYIVAPETPLGEAVQMMFEYQIRHLPVVDDHNAVAGMLSESDVRTAVGDPVDYLNVQGSRKLLVRDAMTYPVVAVAFDRPLLELATAFADSKIGALPIVDKDGALIGIVSYVDALRLLAR